MWDWIGGLDHRPVEMEVEVCGVEVERREDGDGIVEWGKLVVDLEERVERLERELLEGVERYKSRRKWREGKKRWWTGKVEREYRELREVERECERGGGNVEEVREKRKSFKKVAEEEKREHWVRYLEGLGKGEGFK